jgi:hypothetical protein
MGYDIALGMAWEELKGLGLPSSNIISLFQDRYEIKQAEREVLFLPSRRQAIETVSVLLLHYLIGRSKNGYEPAGEWISIKETYGGKLFCSNFSRRAIRPLAERFSQSPEELVRTLQDDFAGRMVEGADVAVEVETFPGVIVRILFWRSDEDLPADATMLFDRALAQILTMEDLTVLLTILADDVPEGSEQSSQ